MSLYFKWEYVGWGEEKGERGRAFQTLKNGPFIPPPLSAARTQGVFQEHASMQVGPTCHSHVLAPFLRQRQFSKASFLFFSGFAASQQIVKVLSLFLPSPLFLSVPSPPCHLSALPALSPFPPSHPCSSSSPLLGTPGLLRERADRILPSSPQLWQWGWRQLSQVAQTNEFKTCWAGPQKLLGPSLAGKSRKLTPCREDLHPEAQQALLHQANNYLENYILLKQRTLKEIV